MNRRARTLVRPARPNKPNKPNKNKNKSKNKNRVQQRTDAEIPLPGGARGKAAATSSGDIGPPQLAQDDAAAGLQRAQHARSGYGQTLSSVYRRHDVRVFASADLRSHSRGRCDQMGQ